MKNFLLLFTIILMMACGSSKKAAQEIAPRPSWVTQKPIDPSAYNGIGFSLKKPGVDYMTNAKNNALNDLTSEISAQVSSSSMIYVLERDYHLKEEFQSSTKVKSNENIEGYELAGTWEDESYYYVWYSLSKMTYEEKAREKKNHALNIALDQYKTAGEQKARNEYAEAMRTYITAMEAIRPYLNESLPVQLNGKEIFFGNVLINDFRALINDIVINPVQPTVEIKRGTAVPAGAISFRVSNRAGNPLSRIPLYLYFSGFPISNNEVLSDKDGLAPYALDKISTTKNAEYFQSDLNLVGLASDATTDPFIKTLVGKMNGATSRIEIKLLSPSIYIDVKQKNFAIALENTLAPAMSRDGYDILTKASGSDYTLVIDIHLSSTKTGGIYKATAYADMQVKNNKGVLISSLKTTNFSANHASEESAKEAAIQLLNSSIERQYWRDIRRKAFD